MSNFEVKSRDFFIIYGTFSIGICWLRSHDRFNHHKKFNLNFKL